MKNRKSKKRTIQQSPCAKQMINSALNRFNIRFEFGKTNLSCFIGEKRQNKKTLSKRQLSQKMRKASQKKKPMVITRQETAKQKSKEKKRVQQSPDIIRESSNIILSEIESKGVGYEWKQSEQVINENRQEDESSENSQIWSVFSVTNQSFQKSYASTMDYQQPLYYHSVDFNTENISFQYKQRSQSFQGNGNVFQVRLDHIGFDPRTTIMIRNIPNKYTIRDLSQEIDRDFHNTYDFLYLPCDLKNQCNVGYGFINFVETSFLSDFYITFHNKKWAKFRSQKICILTYARLQGLSSLIQHFENSKVLNAKEKRYRPIIKPTAKINNLIKTQQQK